MSGQSRVRVLGVAALTAAVAMSVALIGPAQAAKKGKKGPARAVVTKVGIAVPDEPPTPGPWGSIVVPFEVGKQFKGRSVGTVNVTLQVAGCCNGSPSELEARLTSPSGRSIFLDVPPVPNTVSAFGPTTLSPDSSLGPCPSLPLASCNDPNNNLPPPYAGTIGDTTLALYYGTRMRGRWFITFFDTAPNLTNTVSLARLTITAARPIE